MSTKLRPYTTLCDEAVELLLTTRQRARQIVERELAAAYWHVGRLLDAHLQTHGGRAAKSEEVVRQLAAANCGCAELTRRNCRRWRGRGLLLLVS